MEAGSRSVSRREIMHENPGQSAVPLRMAGAAWKIVGFAILLTGSTFLSSAVYAQTALCEPEKADQKFPSYADKTVRIGLNPTYPPFSYSDETDRSKLTGLDVEIVKHAMTCAGLKHEFITGQTSGLYPALFSGSLDAMAGNIFIRPDRIDKAGFVLYMINGQSLVVKTGNPKKIAATGDMCGKRATGLYVGTSTVAVKKISDDCVSAGKPAIEYTAAADQEQSYRALENDRADMVMDGAASAALRVKSSDVQFETAFTLQTDIKSGVIAPKGNSEMLTVLANGLTDLQNSGKLMALMAEYGLEPDWLIPVEVHP
jgi:polar amino acid transport system substrate-binding protein